MTVTEIEGEVDSAECGAGCGLIEAKTEMHPEHRVLNIGGTAHTWDYWLCAGCFDAREREWWA